MRPWAQYCVDKSILLLKGCRALINILLQTDRILEASLENECFWSAADLLCVCLISCFYGQQRG